MLQVRLRGWDLDPEKFAVVIIEVEKTKRDLEYG